MIKNGRVLNAQQGIAEISSSSYRDILTQYKVGDAGVSLVVKFCFVFYLFVSIDYYFY